MSSVAAYLRLRPRLYNPTWELLQSAPDNPKGTYRFGTDWYPLDQILVSAGMLSGASPAFILGSVRVHAPRTVVASDGTIIKTRDGDGAPLAFKAATSVGCSDHFPLVAQIDI